MNESLKKKPCFHRLKLFFLILVAGAFIYFPAVQNTVGWYNSGEFVAAAITLDVPHAPGYPLYTRLCNLGLKIPINIGPAQKVNLITASVGILAAACLFILLKLTGLTDLVSLLSAFLLLFSSNFFEQSIQAEVYNLEILFIVLGLICGVYIAKGSSHPALAFFCGLVGVAGVGHRPTFGIYALSLVFFIKSRKEIFPRDLRFWSYFFVGGLVGLIPTFDLYLRLQNPGRVLLDPMIGRDLDSFIKIITGRVYSGGFFAFDFREALLRFKDICFFLAKDLYVWPIIISIYFALKNRNEAFGNELIHSSYFLILANVAFVANYNAFEAQTMLLPTVLGVVILTGYGLELLLKKKISPKYLSLCLIATFGVFFFSGSNTSHEAENYIKNSYTSLPKNSFLLLSNDVEFRPYWYLRLSQGYRKDLKISLVDEIQQGELKFLNKAAATSKVFSSLVYPENALKSLVASFSIENKGYFHQILLPNEAFKNSNQIALASKTLKIGFDNLKVGVLKSFSGKSWKKGSFFEYFYSFSPKILERKPTTIIGILTRPDGELISYNNILVGLDFHNPLDYICNEDLVNRKNLFIKRNIVLPQNLIPGKYLFKFIAVHGKSFISDERVKEICIPEGITPLNWNGFLEVFKLKYGLCARELIGGKKIIKLKEFIMENKIDSNFFSFEFCVE